MELQQEEAWNIAPHPMDPSAQWQTHEHFWTPEQSNSVPILQGTSQFGPSGFDAQPYQSAVPMVAPTAPHPPVDPVYPHAAPTAPPQMAVHQAFEVNAQHPSAYVPTQWPPIAPNHPYESHPSMGVTQETKKRRMEDVNTEEVEPEPKNAKDIDTVSQLGSKQCPSKKGGLSVPEMIDVIAQKGEALSWDAKTNVYSVLNGNRFLEEFQALRTTRKKTSGTAKDRPFARMNLFYQLIQGDRWSGTGSKFVPLSASQVATNKTPAGPVQAIDFGNMSDRTSSSQNSDSGTPQSPNTVENQGPTTEVVDASRVHVMLTDATGCQRNCTLQHFLDRTGAGELFRRATGVEGSAVDMLDLPPERPITSADINKVVGELWHADSRGDQAYFFFRKDGDAPYSNGSIVFLDNGKVVSDACGGAHSGLFFVVSDKNVKWKGEPVPSPEEEQLGHWCAFLGQVPVFVTGVVRCGEHIGPKMDGSGEGKVVTPGEAPVIGIALSNKDGAESGVVKTLVFAGLNTLQLKGPASVEYSHFLHTQVLEEQIQELMQDYQTVRSDVRDVQVNVDAIVGQNLKMQERLNKIDPAREEEERQLEADDQIVDVITAIPVPSVNQLSPQVGRTHDPTSAVDNDNKPESCQVFWLKQWKSLALALILVLAAVVLCVVFLTKRASDGDGDQVDDGTKLVNKCALEYQVPHADIQTHYYQYNDYNMSAIYAGRGTNAACRCYCKSIWHTSGCAYNYDTIKFMWDTFGSNLMWIQNFIVDDKFFGCGFIKGYDQNGCISFFSDINCNEAKAQTTEEVQTSYGESFDRGECICTRPVGSMGGDFSNFPTCPELDPNDSAEFRGQDQCGLNYGGQLVL